MNTFNTDELLSKLIRNIRKQYHRFERKKRLARLLISLSVFLAGLVILIWFEQLAYFSSTTKLSVLAGLALSSGLLFFWSSRSLSSTSFQQFYSTISSRAEAPQLKHAFDLSLYDREQNLKLYKAALSKNLESIAWDKLKTRIKHQLKRFDEHKYFKKSLSAAIGSGIILFMSGMIYSEAFVRTAKFWENFQKPNPYSYSIAPGDITIEQGSTFQPEITFEGDMPEELLLGIKTNIEKEFRYRPLQENGNGKFITTEPIKLSSNATYFVSMDEFKSDSYNINVQLRPRFESLSVNVFPPEYTGLDSTRYTYPFSRVRAYQGSEIQIEGTTNKTVNRLLMFASISGDTLLPDAYANNTFSFRQEISATDTLRFAMSDSSGLTNNNSFEFAVEAVQDEQPYIQIVDPEGDVEMGTPSPLDISFEASDDFGITSASLHFEIQRAFVQNPETGSIKLDNPRLNTPQSYTWDVTALSPKPRDVITFWIEITDNDRYNGFKRSQSRKLTITLPSLVENFENIQEQEADVQKNLEDISESYDEMRREYDRFKENLKENPETNWEQKQMLQEMQQKQQEIDQKVQDLNKKFEKIRKEIDQNKLISEDTKKAYEELQKLIEDINDPELQKALEELQNSMGNLNQEQLRKALENFEFNEEVYQERLKRTIELFKSLKLNSDLEKIATALEDLAKKEGELSETESSPSDQAKQQEVIQDDTEKVSDQLNKLNEDPPRDAREKLEKLEREGQQDLDSIRKELEQNIEQLKQGNPDSGQNQPSPQQQQQQIQQQFQQLAQKMRESKQQFSQQRMQVNMAALQNILYNLINISEEQEDLTQRTESLANRSQAFVENARTEKNINDQFKKVSDSLFAVSSQIPGFSNRINEKKKAVERDLQRAVEQLAERNKSQSTYAERQSLGGINELASMVASLMDQLQNQSQSGMGGGMSMQQFLEQMKNMSGDQQQLNQRIQNLINDIQGDRLTRDQIDRLNQMARQQNQIRKQLRELQQQGGLEGGDRLLSELERMAEEMEETINDLRGGQTDRLLIKRQQNILSRMLNAEKALQERDKEEKREGTEAEDAPKTVPPDVTLEELQKKIRSLLNDPNQTRFSDDYQKLIEQYFELLKKLQEKGVSS